MSTRSARYGTLGLHTPKGRMVSGVDRDAGAFLEAAQIFNTRQQQAIFELVRLFKQYGLWSRMRCIYPFIGGSAENHKWNLKDPRDLDAAYRLTFSGGWTHSSTGALPNGTNAFANTFFATNVLARDNGHMAYYSRTNSTPATGTPCDMGSVNAPQSTYSDIFISYTSGAQKRSSVRWCDGADFRYTVAPTNTSGLFSMTRSIAGVDGAFMYVDGSLFWTSPALFVNNVDTTKIYIAASNNTGTAQWYSPRECAFASIGEALTAAEHSLLNAAVNRYQRLLGRNV